MTERTFTPRDLVRIPLGPADEPHRAVVMSVAEDTLTLRVIASTSKRRSFPCVVVEPRTRDGIALRLTATTYFYESALYRVRAEDVLERYGRCPPQLFAALRKLVEDQLV